MARIQDILYSVLIFVCIALCHPLKGNSILGQVLPLGTCSAESCETDKGMLECLRTGSFASYLSNERFFYRNQNDQYVYRTISVVVQVKDSAPNGKKGSDSYLRPVKIQKVVALVNPLAYKAFLGTIRSNPHCLRTFCHANCLKVSALKSKYIKAQVKSFSNAIVPLTIQGKTYSPSELKELDPEKSKSLAIIYLLEARGSILSASCLGEDMNSIILRMICSQCPHVLERTNSDLNMTCASFDLSQNVGYDEQPADKNPILQSQMAASIAIQNALTKRAIGNRNNPAATADLNQLTSQLNDLYNHPTSTFEELVNAYNHAKDVTDPSRSGFQRASDAYNAGKGLIAAY